MNRYTFVVHIHPGGLSTLENLSTDERIAIADLAAVGPQIERWLAALPAPPSPSPSASASDGERPSPGAPPA